MTTVKLEYTLADSCLAWRTVLYRVLLPATLGTATLLIVRNALYLWPLATYSEPSAGKEFLIWSLVILTACVIYRSVYEMRVLSRAHFLETYLKPESVLHRLLSGKIWNRAVSATLSLGLAILAYIVIQSYPSINIVMIGVACAIGLWFSQAVGYLLTDSLKAHVSDLLLDRMRRAIVLFWILSAVVLTTVAQDIASPWITMEEKQIVPEMKKQIRHPNYWVQTVTRDMLYLNVKLVRMRDHVPASIGWLIYLFLLVPNTIPLYAVSCVYLGCEPKSIAAASMTQKGVSQL